MARVGPQRHRKKEILFEWDDEFGQFARNSTTNSKGADSIPDLIIWNFHKTNPSILNAILARGRLSL